MGWWPRRVVYAIIGWSALRFSLGDGGGFLDKEDVARKVELQPFGTLLLLALGVGLVCYAAWRLVDALQTLTGAPDGHRSWLAWALGEPGGRWLFVGAGLIMCGVGVCASSRARRSGRSSCLSSRRGSSRTPGSCS